MHWIKKRHGLSKNERPQACFLFCRWLQSAKVKAKDHCVHALCLTARFLQKVLICTQAAGSWCPQFFLSSFNREWEFSSLQSEGFFRLNMRYRMQVPHSFDCTWCTTSLKLTTTIATTTLSKYSRSMQTDGFCTRSNTYCYIIVIITIIITQAQVLLSGFRTRNFTIRHENIVARYYLISAAPAHYSRLSEKREL